MPSSLVTRIRGRFCKARGAAGSTIDGQALETTHVGSNRARQQYAAVGLLAVLEQGDQGAADREAGTVQRVHEPGLALALGAIAGAHPARLEVAAVRAAGDLAIAPLARQPDLNVVRLARGKARIAAAQQHHAVRQL